MYSLYPFQQKAVDEIRGAYQNKFEAPLFVGPTGSGKTVIFSHIAESAVSRQKKVLILTHRYELLKQTSKALSENRIMHGLINPKFKPNRLAPIQVASVQALNNRLAEVDRDFDLIIIDEAHHATADSWRDVVSSMPNSKLLGVTATPTRSDGQGLGKRGGGLFDTMVMGPQIGELINQGYLKKFKVFGSGNILDLSGVKKVRGEYHSGQLEEKLNRRSITGNAVHEYGRICPGVPAIVFCISLKHCQEVAAEFCEKGWRFAAIDGKMSEKQRTGLIEGLANGTYDGLCSCELISEGTDIPAVGAAICLRPTMSVVLWLQMCGRAGRLFAGQEFAYILDHANNVFRHGLPDEDRAWTLDSQYIYEPNTGGTESRSKIIQCKNCNALVMRASHCSHCEVAMIITKPLIVINGFLTEILPEDKEKIERVREAEAGQTDFKPLSYFQELAVHNNYKMGWAHHRYKAQFKKAQL